MYEYIKKKSILLLVILLFQILTTINVTAEEVKNIETTGSISFTGVYEPIGTPDPIPSESIDRTPITEVAKPGGTLPQTNDYGSSWLLWAGILIISFVFLLWKRKNKQIQK